MADPNLVDFYSRVARFEREFDAMIPLTLARPTMPWPGSGSHAERCLSASDGTAAKPDRQLGQVDQAATIRD